VPADIAWSCQQSVPIVKEDALNLVDGLNVALEWQSTLEYLKTPPADYPYPPVDLQGRLTIIRRKVEDDQYDNEIAFELDIINVLNKAHDGHLGFAADGWHAFSYVRGGPDLASVALDDSSDPAIYALRKHWHPHSWSPY
jgi:hypothetical protein